jgi:formylglycine-generating enzyme required for sulfatase activity
MGRWVAAGVLVVLLGGGAWYFRQGAEDQAAKADAARVAAEILAREESARREKAEALAREEAERRVKLEGDVKRQAELAEKVRLEEEARKAAEEKARALSLKMDEAEKKKAELAARRDAEARKLAEAEARAHAETESRRLAEIAAKRQAEEKAKVEEEAKAEAARKLAEAKAAPRKPGAAFRDCPECPQMVVIPAGDFSMGASATDLERTPEEGPPRVVRIETPFAIARTEVTVAQFRRFVRATKRNIAGCAFWDGKKFANEADRNWEAPKYPQENNHPVVCVSWLDATAFVDWMSKETGKHYRLPTEAEWEYAARGGTRSSRFWGDSPAEACAFANVHDRSARQNFPQVPIHECDDGHMYTAPVGSLRPNSFGLHDMLGNVWELTADCWNANYVGAPTNGSAWITGECTRRVTRGGGWLYGPRLVRSAVRVSTIAGGRNFHVGFRIARTLD